MGRSGRLPPEALQPYLLDVPNPRSLPPDVLTALTPSLQVLDWRQLFGNDRPVEIEVGFGKGLFLLNQSQARPNVNFLGLEIERKYVLHTAARLARQQATNVKLAATDARWFLKQLVAADSVEALHVYFPDPWWKKRHQKRKLFTLEFAEQVARVLRPGGQLHFVTDVRDYFEDTLRMLDEQGGWQPLPTTELAEGDYLTNFERKYRQEGRPIYRQSFASSPHSPPGEKG